MMNTNCSFAMILQVKACWLCGWYKSFGTLLSPGEGKPKRDTIIEHFISKCNWFLKSPSDMESYIRPDCVFLSVYLSIPSSSWEQLKENILQRINSLIHHPDTDF